MNRIILIMTLFLANVASYAQQAQESGIFYNNEKLGYSRITGQRIGNLAGAYFSFGLSGAKRTLQIEGKTADLKIDELLPTFTIVFGDSTVMPPVFSNVSNFDHLILVRLKRGKHERKLQNGSYGLTGVESNVTQKYVVPLKIEQISSTKFVVKPREELKEGEYGFFFNLPKPDKDNQEDTSEKQTPFNGIFDFTITK